MTPFNTIKALIAMILLSGCNSNHVSTKEAPSKEEDGPLIDVTAKVVKFIPGAFVFETVGNQNGPAYSGRQDAVLLKVVRCTISAPDKIVIYFLPDAEEIGLFRIQDLYISFKVRDKYFKESSYNEGVQNENHIFSSALVNIK